MGIALAVFRTAGKTPVENDQLQIVQDGLIFGLEEGVKL